MFNTTLDTEELDMDIKESQEKNITLMIDKTAQVEATEVPKRLDTAEVTGEMNPLYTKRKETQIQNQERPNTKKSQLKKLPRKNTNQKKNLLMIESKEEVVRIDTVTREEVTEETKKEKKLLRKRKK